METVGTAAPATHGATTSSASAPSPADVDLAAYDPFLDDLQERTFRWFWDLAHPETGLIPDRWPHETFASIAASGFGLTAYPIGVEHGWVTRQEAAERTRRHLRFLWQAPQGEEATGVIGYKGFYYHFLNMETGERFEQTELSTVDTSLLLGGVLFARQYWNGDDDVEDEIRELATKIYERVEWDWPRPNAPAIKMGWRPERSWTKLDWDGYNEAMLVYVFALGSPTHPVEPEAWTDWTSTYEWGTWRGQPHVMFEPLFGHQYSHLWIDFRGIQDAYMRDKAVEHPGIDYFENSRRAALAQHDWSVENPRRWKGIDGRIWGISACDGPIGGEYEVELADGSREERRFFTYAGRGVGPDFQAEDGTLTPTATGGSVPFAPEITIPTLAAMKEEYGDHLWGEYGFLDSFNPTFQRTDVEVRHGTVVPGVGWFDGDYLGIDQGPILAMIENHRSGLVWEYLRRDPAIRRGLERAGFTGGWLEETAASPETADGETGAE